MFPYFFCLRSYRGCLYPLPMGFHKFTMSKTLSIILINFTVGWLFANCANFIDKSKNSMAFASDELVWTFWAANLTFILCFSCCRCCDENLFPRLGPSVSCRLCKSWKNYHWVSSLENVLVLASAFLDIDKHSHITIVDIVSLIVIIRVLCGTKCTTQLIKGANANKCSISCYWPYTRNSTSAEEQSLSILLELLLSFDQLGNNELGFPTSVFQPKKENKCLRCRCLSLLWQY